MHPLATHTPCQLDFQKVSSLETRDWQCVRGPERRGGCCFYEEYPWVEGALIAQGEAAGSDRWLGQGCAAARPEEGT